MSDISVIQQKLNEIYNNNSDIATDKENALNDKIGQLR